MVGTSRSLVALVFLAAAMLLSAPVPRIFSQQAAPVDAIPVTITVTVLGPNFSFAPEIPKRDVTVYSDKTRLDVTRWEHAQANGSDLQLAILIDDDVRTSLIANQLSDLAHFINSLPPSASVGVFYAQHGSAYAAAPFGTEHAKAAKSLHLTLGGAGESPSIYLSLADLAAHWPAQQGTRREVLLISSGNDPLFPDREDPYLDSALADIQKADISVHALYVGSRGYGLSFRGNISQGKLDETSGATGGQAFVNLPSPPVSLAPYLDNLNKTLADQYLLTFLMEPSHKKEGELRPIQIRTEERDVKIFAPKQVVVATQ